MAGTVCTDVLTCWHNRRYLQTRMKEELARACRDGSGLVCMMLDIDHFKRVKDTWGQVAGDSVLRELAQRIDGEALTARADVALYAAKAAGHDRVAVEAA